MAVDALPCCTSFFKTGRVAAPRAVHFVPISGRLFPLTTSPNYNSSVVSFRAIFLWLMMFAVPFQGYAAAAMAVCAPGSAMSMEAVSASTGSHHDHGDAVSAGHHADAQVDAHDHGADAGEDDAGRKCGNCAPCHAVGLTPAVADVKNFGLPQADLVEPVYALAIVSPGVPHKPPRA